MNRVKIEPTEISSIRSLFVFRIGNSVTLWMNTFTSQKFLLFETLINFHFIIILQYKLCKVKKVTIGPKKIPYLVTHDGRTLRYPDPMIHVNDTIQLDIASGKITDHIRFESGELSAAYKCFSFTNFYPTLCFQSK